MRKPLDEYISERNRAFETDDLQWTRRFLTENGTPPSHESVVIMAFHKARYECPGVSEKKRLESQKWLFENKVTKLDGTFVEPGEALPC